MYVLRRLSVSFVYPISQQVYNNVCERFPASGLGTVKWINPCCPCLVRLLLDVGLPSADGRVVRPYNLSASSQLGPVFTQHNRPQSAPSFCKTRNQRVCLPQLCPLQGLHLSSQLLCANLFHAGLPASDCPQFLSVQVDGLLAEGVFRQEGRDCRIDNDWSRMRHHVLPDCKQ